MKKDIYIPSLGDVQFDFMYMKEDCIKYIDGELKYVFTLECTDKRYKGHNLVLGINFNYNNRAIDERFPRYCYTELESIHSIELYDYDIECRFEKFSTNQIILKIARSIMQREYTEILTIDNYEKSKA